MCQELVSNAWWCDGWRCLIIDWAEVEVSQPVAIMHVIMQRFIQVDHATNYSGYGIETLFSAGIVLICFIGQYEFRFEAQSFFLVLRWSFDESKSVEMLFAECTPNACEFCSVYGVGGAVSTVSSWIGRFSTLLLLFNS